MTVSNRTILQEMASIRWMGRDGDPIACQEKVKVLNENYEEIRSLCQQAFEDAVIMGCSEHFIRTALTEMVASLTSPYAKNGANQ